VERDYARERSAELEGRSRMTLRSVLDDPTIVNQLKVDYIRLYQQQ
jgi:hypothetical protein